MAEQYMHKNRLQEYAQRAAIPLPIYQTVNEGSPHAPQFRSTVFIDGTTFKSTIGFTHRKAAEQDVARLALEGISRKIKHEGVPLIQNDTVFCKSILYEYAVKMNLDKPTYTTSQSEGLLPMFISSVLFVGKTYRGCPGRNKKEAEQLGARAVIESILGTSNSRTFMSQIIKSKGKLYAAVNKGSGTSSMQNQNVMLGGHIENHSTSSVLNGQAPQVAAYQLPSPAVVQSFPPVKEESAEIENGTSGLALAQGNAPTGSTEGPRSDESNVAHCNQAVEIASVSQSVLPNDTKGTPKASSSGRKRTKKDQGESPSKKARTGEQHPPEPPVEQ